MSRRTIRRCALAAVSAALLPAYAFGQPGPPMRPSADDRAVSRTGITVTGRGVADASADHIRVTVRFFAPMPNNAVNFDDTAKAVVAAMQSAGIANAREVLPIEGGVGPNVAPTVVATIDHPTRETLERLARQTAAALPDRTSHGSVSFNVAAALVSDDCTPAETRAQQAAIADARKRAQRAAGASGLHLGSIVAVNETGNFLPAGCPTSPDPAPFFGGAYNIDPSGPLAVPITVNATVTFSIR